MTKEITVKNVVIEIVKLESKILSQAPKFYGAVFKGALKGITVGSCVYVSCWLKAVDSLLNTGRDALVEYCETFDISEEDAPDAFEQWDMMIAGAALAQEGVLEYIEDQVPRSDEEDTYVCAAVEDCLN